MHRGTALHPTKLFLLGLPRDAIGRDDAHPCHPCSYPSDACTLRPRWPAGERTQKLALDKSDSAAEISTRLNFQQYRAGHPVRTATSDFPRHDSALARRHTLPPRTPGDGHPPPPRRSDGRRDHGRPAGSADVLRGALRAAHPRREGADPAQGRRAALRLLPARDTEATRDDVLAHVVQHVLRRFARAGRHRAAPHVRRRHEGRRDRAAARAPSAARGRTGDSPCPPPSPRTAPGARSRAVCS